MNSVLLVEYSSRLGAIRTEILESLGYPIHSVAGSQGVANCNLEHCSIGVIVIGHGAPWEERREVIKHFQKRLPGVPIVALLRRADGEFSEATFNCPADNPPQWIRMVRQAVEGVR